MLIKYFRVPRSRIVEKCDCIYKETTYHPVGCMVGEIIGDEYFLGVSWCHPNDTFNKKMAREIAIGRMNKVINGKDRSLFVPSRYKKYDYQVDKFIMQLEKLWKKNQNTFHFPLDAKAENVGVTL